MKKYLALLLIISFLSPSLVLAFAYEPDQPLAQYPEEAMFLGVCSGLARKTGIAPIYFRVGFVLSTLTGGMGLFAYFILAAIMPTRHSPPFVLSEQQLPPIQIPSSTSSDEKPVIYFNQLNTIMTELSSAGSKLVGETLQGTISGRLEYWQKVKNMTVEAQGKFEELTAPPGCEDIRSDFSEYFRYSISSEDIMMEGLETGDESKIEEATVQSKNYAEKADESYQNARSKIINWEK